MTARSSLDSTMDREARQGFLSALCCLPASGWGRVGPVKPPGRSDRCRGRLQGRSRAASTHRGLGCPSSLRSARPHEALRHNRGGRNQKARPPDGAMTCSGSHHGESPLQTHSSKYSQPASECGVRVSSECDIWRAGTAPGAVHLERVGLPIPGRRCRYQCCALPASARLGKGPSLCRSA